MNHRVFTILACVSLALAVATIVMWPVTYAHNLRVTCSGKTENFSLLGVGGKIVLLWSSPATYLDSDNTVFVKGHADGSIFDIQPAPWEWKDLWAFQITSMPFPAITLVVFPFWVLLLPSLPMLLLWFRRHRRRPFVCLSCGYDLRASKDKCPECGAAIPAKAS